MQYTGHSFDNERSLDYMYRECRESRGNLYIEISSWKMHRAISSILPASLLLSPFPFRPEANHRQRSPKDIAKQKLNRPNFVLVEASRSNSTFIGQLFRFLGLYRTETTDSVILSKPDAQNSLSPSRTSRNENSFVVKEGTPYLMRTHSLARRHNNFKLDTT